MDPKDLISTDLLKSLIFLIALSFIVPQIALSQDQRSKEVAPDQQIRSSIHSVDGYAYLSENITISDIRAVAFSEAKRKALEMAKTYIKSKTKIENFVVKYDMIWSEAEGAVTILEQKDFGIESNTRYHVWIKADVEYKLKAKNDPYDQLMDLGLPLKVKVWTSKKRYKRGENIEIFIQGNRNFYARIVDITSTGEIIQLLPNKYRSIQSFKAGEIYRIPDKGDQFDLKVTEPFGTDNIVVYASEVPLGQVSMESMERGLRLYRGSREKLASKTRGIEVLSKKLESDSGAEFYESTWSLTTSR